MIQAAEPKAEPGASSITRYQWFVFAVAGGAWLFDNLDQRLFSLARIPALTVLMHLPGGGPEVQAFAKMVTAVFLIGWGAGGMVIGALGDRFGRARLLTLSVLLYAAGTGLTALSQTAHHFAVLRCLTGFGIGGVFGLAVANISENFEGSRRLQMLAALQILSTVGNIGAAFVKLGVDDLSQHGVLSRDSVWRWLFAVGALPAMLAVISATSLKESPAWTTLRDSGNLPRGLFGSYVDLFTHRDTRRNLVIGSLLASAGVVGLWAIGEYAVDLQDTVFTAHFIAIDPTGAIKQEVAAAKDWAYFLQMAGGAAGMALFSWVAAQVGRREAFMGGFAAGLLVTFLVYWQIQTPAEAYWMMPLMGAAQLSVFAGFAIYLPELFAPNVRGTGVSFCYNVGRFAAAGASFVSATLANRVFNSFRSPLPLRYSAMTMCAIFLIGIVAAIAAPETRGPDWPGRRF